MPASPTPPPSLLEILTINPARDSEGRALLESAADQEALDEIRKTYETCTYEDSPSRLEHEKPMNMAALEQAKRNFAGMLAVLRALRNIHLESVGGATLVLDDWRKICLSGEILPRYLYVRHRLLHGGSGIEDYYSYPIPADVSTLFKTVRGIAKLLDYLHDNPNPVANRLPKEMATRLGIPKPKSGSKKGGKRGARKAAVSKPLSSEGIKMYRAANWSADDLIWAAETFDLFVGETEVCAAPTNMVRATLGALIDGKNPHDELELTDELKELIGEGAEFSKFVDVLGEYYRELRLFRDKCSKSMERISRELQPLSSAQHGRALAICLDGFENYLVPEHQFLESCRAAQAELLEAAGHSEPPPALSLEFIDKIIPQNRRSLAKQRFGIDVAHTDEAIEVTLATANETVTESIPFAGD